MSPGDVAWRRLVEGEWEGTVGKTPKREQAWPSHGRSVWLEQERGPRRGARDGTGG